MQGGEYIAGDYAGITMRFAEFDFTTTFPSVASVCRHQKLIKYYTDLHDVDEDARTIGALSDMWTGSDRAGIMNRHISNSFDEWNNATVAYIQKKITGLTHQEVTPVRLSKYS